MLHKKILQKNKEMVALLILAFLLNISQSIAIDYGTAYDSAYDIYDILGDGTNRTGNLNITFQARSCDDASCDAEIFVGPDNTSTTYFENSTLTELNTTLTPNNQFFQYIAYFHTEDLNYTPMLFNVTVDYNPPPVVSLNDPVDFANLSTALDFNYTVTGNNLDTCELWGNWTTGWHLNESFVNPSSDVANGSSVVTIEEGLYVWNVYCNNTANNYNNSAPNRTLTVDATFPVVSIDYPVNSSTVSGSNLDKDFNFSIIENNIESCWYELNSSGENITITDCNSGNRSVVITLVKALWNNISIWVNDTAGNEAWNITYVYTNTAPDLPSLTLPLNNSQHVLNNLTFEWTAVTDVDGDSVTYDINFTNDTFDEVGFVSGLTTNNHANDSLPDGWLYWQVRSYDGKDYSANWSDEFYVDNIAAEVEVSPYPSVVKNPGQSQTFTITQVARAEWTTNLSIWVHGDGVDTGVVDASNDSSDLDSTWSYTYTIPSSQNPSLLVVDVYGWNNTLAENVTNSTQIFVSKPLGPAISTPRITGFYPNTTYVNSGDSVEVVLNADLDVLNKSVSVSYSKDGSNSVALNLTSTSADNTNYDYNFNYSFVPSGTGTYNVTGSITDTNDNSNETSFVFYVSDASSINLTTAGGTNINVKDIQSGISLASGSSVNQSFVTGEYNVEVTTSIGTVKLNNATLNETGQVVLEYVDKDESASVPSNTLSVDRFSMSSEQLFSNNAQIVYDYSSVNTSIINENNLEVYKCDSEASCTWSEISSSVDSSVDTVTATFSSFSIFLVSEDIATLTATSPAAGNPGGGAALQKASIKIVTPAALSANPLKMLLEDTVRIPLRIQNNGNKALSDISISSISENPLIRLSLDKTSISSLDVGGSEIVMATIKSALKEPGVYTVKLLASVGSPAVSDESELIVAVVTILEEKVQQIVTRVVFAKDLFKEHPECLELQELLDKADQAIKSNEYERARTLTESAILGCQDMITSLTMKKEVPSRLPFTKQQIIILIVVGSSILTLLTLLIISPRKRKVIYEKLTEQRKRFTFEIPRFKKTKTKERKERKVNIWKRT